MSTVTLNDYGKSNWTDYVDYWRDDDAEYLQARTILRYHNMTDAAADNPTPLTGQVVYSELDDLLFFRSKTNAWRRYGPMPFNMAPSADSATGVGLQHAAAPGGVLFTSPTGTPASVVLAQVPLHSAGSAVILDSTGITFKTGTPLAKLTWDGTTLSVDSPVSVPNLTVRAGGVLTVPSLTVNGPATVSGLLTASGNVAVTGTISAPALASSISGVTFGDRSINAAKGVQSVGGVLYGQPSSMRVGAGTIAAPGAAYLDVASTVLTLQGTTLNLNAQPEIVAKGINYRVSQGSNPAYGIVPSFYAATDPGAGNFPDGTIWVS